MKKIGIVGYGYVGIAVAKLFKDQYEMKIYDINYNFISKDGDPTLNFVKSIEEINDCDLAVVCVPTPMQETENEFKECDTSIVEDVVKKLETPVILIKSTITPGTTDKLKEETGKRIVFSPEYAGEGKYWSPYKFDKDMKECPFVILGGDKKDTAYVLDLIVPILGPKKFYYQVSAKEAEVIRCKDCFRK